MSKKLVFCFVFVILLASPLIFAGNFVAFQGNVKQGGVALASGNLSVAIFDAMSAGNLIYNSTTNFNGAISDGKYDVMLGNGSNVLNLKYGRKYYLEMFVNGESFSFNGQPRQVFESAVGNVSYVYMEANIPASYINKSGGTNWVGTNVESILDTIYSWINAVNSTENLQGFGFSMNDTNAGTICADTEVLLGNGSCYNSSLFGSSSGDITKVNTSEDYIYGGANSGEATIYFNETRLNATIDLRATGLGDNASWNQTFASSLFSALLGGNTINGTQNFDGGWTQGGITISAGKLFAQTIYVYNLSSLSVNQVNVNGSMIPHQGFDNIFDLGSSVLRWRNVYVGENVSVGKNLVVTGNANVTGNLTLGAGQIIWNQTGYIFYNGTGYQEFGTGSGGTTSVLGVSFKQYVANSSSGPGSFNVSGTGWTTTRGVAVPYKTTTGDWRMKFNIAGSLNVTSATLDLTISGVTFKNVDQQAVVGYISTENNWVRGYAAANTGVLSLSAGASSTGWKVSGDVELNSKPTWADDVNGSNLWSQSGNNIYYNSGNVGIGTSAPTQKLNVVGNVNVTQNLSIGGAIIYREGNDLVFRI